MSRRKVGHISNDGTFWYFGSSTLCRNSALSAREMPPSTAVNLYVDWFGFTTWASCIWISNHEISCSPNRFMSRSLTFTVLVTTHTSRAGSSRRTLYTTSHPKYSISAASPSRQTSFGCCRCHGLFHIKWLPDFTKAHGFIAGICKSHEVENVGFHNLSNAMQELFTACSSLSPIDTSPSKSLDHFTFFHPVNFYWGADDLH